MIDAKTKKAIKDLLAPREGRRRSWRQVEMDKLGVRFSTVWTDQHGDSCKRLISFPRPERIGLIPKMIDAIAIPVDGSHCCCSHDCCGHWFADRGRLVVGKARVYWMQSWYRNV